MKSVLRWTRRLEILLLCALVFLLLCFWWLDAAIKPNILAIGESQASNFATAALYSAMYEIAGEMSYEDLVEVRTDKNGKVNFMQMNTAAMNRLAAKTAIVAMERMDTLDMENVTVPLFTALGSQLFMGTGPLLHLHIYPSGSISTEFHTEFVSAGINQTRHRVYLTLHGTVSVVIPNAKRSVGVSAQILVAEGVVVGDIPQWYSATDSKNVTPLDLAPGR